MALSGEIGVHLTATYNRTDLDMSAVPSLPFSKFLNWTITSGTGANQADLLFFDERTLSTGATEDLDFSGTTLQNIFGTNIAYVKIKGLIFYAAAANTTNITIGGTAATQFLAGFGAATHTWTLLPGAVFASFTPNATGWAVAAGSTDLFKVANSAGASATYGVIVIGTTA